MIATLVVETTAEARAAAQAVLSTMGYPVSCAPDDPSRLHVQVRPGEKPQAALRVAGIAFNVRAVDA